MKKFSKNYKLIALLLAAVILLTTIPLTISGFGNKSSITMENASEEDRRIASEISNETGFSTEEIFELKSKGRSWNEVLKVLKTSPNLSKKRDISNRNDLLLNSGFDEEYIKKLKTEGFTDEEITEAKMLEERIVFQLLEIVQKDESAVEKPEIIISSLNKDKEDISVYKKLFEKIDAKNAIYFMLKLNTDFGSYEKAFDEYLYSLQAELDLNEYIKDKQAYLKSKEDKRPLLDEQSIITLEKIEQKAIESIQKENNENESTDALQQKDSTAETDNNSSVSQEKSPLPDVPKPEASDVKPKNPTEDIMKEIREISPMQN